VTAFDSNPAIQTPVPRWHWLALACAVLVTVAGLLAIGWNQTLHPYLDEKRVLATRPAWPHSLPQLRAFPRAFDDYVHDQFPPRVQLIAGLNYLRYRLGYSGVSRVIVGRNGWLFYDHDNHLGYPAASTPMSPFELEVWADVFEARSQLLAHQGITYAVLVAPQKETIYPVELPDWALRAARIDDQSAIVGYLHRRGLGGYLDLRPALVEAVARGQHLYAAFETHWNGEGAYLGYRALMQRLSLRFPQLQPLPLGAFPHDVDARTPGDLAYMLGIAGLVHADFPQFVSPPSPLPASIEYLGPRRDWTAPRVVVTGFPGPSLLMTVDSFSTALLPFLSPHFSRIILAHNQDGWFRQDLIERFHPDIVVLEVVESGVRFSMSGPLPVPTRALQAPPHFIEQPDATLPGAALDCNLERAESLAETSAPPQQGHDVLLSGWVAQLARQRTAPQVRIVLQSPQATYALMWPVDVVRGDVAEYFHRSGIAISGFSVRASMAGVRPGHYAVTLQQHFADGDAACKAALALDVH